jgi:sulfur transfer protein SufE
LVAALDAIVSELSEADRQERIELLIDFAKNLKPLRLPEILGMLRVRGLSGVLARLKKEVTKVAGL